MKMWMSLLCALALVALVGCAGETPAPTAATTAPQPNAAPATIDAPPPSGDMPPAAVDTPVVSTPIPLQDAPPVDVPPPAGAQSLPVWQTIALTDAISGETFTLADLRGKTVLVHAMATWCTTCRAHQRVLRDSVFPQLSDEDFAYVSLSVAENVSNDALQTYANRENFGWRFAAASPEMTSALVATFGRAFTTPPSTPHFIVRPDGTATQLYTGASGASVTLDRLRAAAGE